MKELEEKDEKKRELLIQKAAACIFRFISTCGGYNPCYVWKGRQ